MIINKQTGSDEQGIPNLVVVYEYEPQWKRNMGGYIENDLPLDQGLSHQAELKLLKISQSTMNELGGSGGSPLGQVILFTKHHRSPSTRGVPGDTCTVYTSTKDK